MKKGMTLQNKFLIVCLCISILPLLGIGVYSYYVASENMRQSIHQSNVHQLENADKLMYEKMKNIQRKVDIIRYDNAISQNLFGDEILGDALNERLGELVSDTGEIKSVIVVLNSGEMHLYNISPNFDGIRFQVIYGRMNESPGFLNWMVLNESENKVGLNESYIIVGTVIGKGDNSAKVYLMLDKKIFDEAISKDSTVESIYIFDNEGNYVAGSEYKNLIMETSIDNVTKIFNENSGVIEMSNVGMRKIITHYTSALTNWKYIKVQESDIFYRELSYITNTVSVVVILLCLFVFVAYILIIRHITKPLTELSDIMKNFEEDMLKTPLHVKSNDEIGTIIRGYNKMLKRITLMVENIKNEEQQKKNAELRARTYQINPHFLYNTIAMIRITAIKNAQSEIAEMLLILSRIFRKIITNTDKYITLWDEVGQIKDYVTLLKLRKNINFTVEYNIPTRLEHKSIPGMLLQPIIENSVVHGFYDEEKGLNIRISAFEKDEYLIVEVFDNGCGIDEEKIRNILEADEEKTGIGLRNIDERIKLLFGNKFGVEIVTEMGEYTNIRLMLPNEI